MKSITADQLEPIKQTILYHPSYSDGEFTFSVIHPWSPEAWQAEGLMEEVIKAGYDHASPILTRVHICDPDNDVDMYNDDVNVYKQFAFPDQVTGSISQNVRTWLEDFRASQAKPPVKLLGNRLDILEEKIPKDAYVVQNTFVIHHIKEEITLDKFIESISIIPGDVIRIYTFDENIITPLFPPFLYQTISWKSAVVLFQVK